jgi:hypothetical protein
VYAGRELRSKAQRSQIGYVNSAPFIESGPAAPILDHAYPLLKQRLDRGISPILSSEGWLYKSEHFRQQGLFEKLGGNVHIILFVRPQVDWLNSAWWQWNVWNGALLDTYLLKSAPNTDWGKAINDWQNTPGVGKVSVGLVAGDVSHQFYELIGAPRAKTAKINSGIPHGMLHFLIRNREFRKNRHDSGTEFVLERHLTGTRNSTPWAFSQQQVERILERNKPQMDALLECLEPHQRALVQSDPRWWDKSAYADRETETAGQPQSRETLVGLIEKINNALPPMHRTDSDAAAMVIRQAAQGDYLTMADDLIADRLRSLVKHDELLRSRGRFKTIFAKLRSIRS